MSEEQHPPSTSFPVIQALRERIETETPHLWVMGLFEHPCPSVKVKDTVHGILVGFSCEAHYVTYVQIMARTGEKHHA